MILTTPRSGQTLSYIGGRAEQQTNNQYIFDSDRSQNYMYVGITPSFVTNNGLSNIDVVVLDGTREVARYNLEDNFRAVTGSGFTNATVNHYVYDDDGTNQQEPINYSAGNEIQLVVAGTRRGFTINENNVDLTNNIENLQEDQLSQSIRSKLNSSRSARPWENVAEVLFSGAAIEDVHTLDRVEYTTGYSLGVDWRDMTQSTTTNANRYIDSDLTITASNASFEVDGFGNVLQKLVALKLQRNDANNGIGAMMEIGNSQAFIRINTSNNIQVNTTVGSNTDTWVNIADANGALTLGSGGNNFLVFEMVPVVGGTPPEDGELIADFYDGTNYHEANNITFTPTGAATGNHLGFSRSLVQRGQVTRFSAINSAGYLSHNFLDGLVRQHQDDKWNFGFARLFEGSNKKAVDFTTLIKGTVLTGTSAPAINPDFIGQFFVDTTGKNAYIAIGSTSGDWVQINNN